MRGNQVLTLCLLLLVGLIVGIEVLRPGGWGESFGWSTLMQGVVVVCVSTVLLLVAVATTFSPDLPERRVPTPPEEFEEHGLGSLAADTSAASLYLDLMKRSLLNIIYADDSLWTYTQKEGPIEAKGFHLDRRVNGEDSPQHAHTMVGLKRLDNVQQCVETILQENIPGDLVEMGSHRGGVTVFMRAILKAHHEADRKVYVCDAFSPQHSPPRIRLGIMLALGRLLGSIKSPATRRRVFMKLQQRSNAFPNTADPSDSLVNFLFWQMQHAHIALRRGETGLDWVKSNFARYGLLDDQVVLLKGFFSETLRDPPFEQVAVMRLDGDLYESTVDSLVPVYPRLVPGGFCIVDDYYAFPDCKRAIDEYREEHGIQDELIDIDNNSVYWRKSGE